MRIAAILMIACSIAVAVGVFTKDWIRFDDSELSIGPIGGVERCARECESVSWEALQHKGISGMAQALGMAVAFGALIAAVTGLACGVQLARAQPAPVKPASGIFSTMVVLALGFVGATLVLSTHVHLARQPVGWAGVCGLGGLVLARLTLVGVTRRLHSSPTAS